MHSVCIYDKLTNSCRRKHSYRPFSLTFLKQTPVTVRMCQTAAKQLQFCFIYIYNACYICVRVSMYVCMYECDLSVCCWIADSKRKKLQRALV